MKKIFKKSGFKYLVAFLLPFIILISMLVQPMITNMFGEEIFIKTKPYDPRDLFRGDYVRLNYEINEISADKLSEEILEVKSDEKYNHFENLKDKKLYVVLKRNGPIYEVDRVTLNKPKEGIFLKAKYAHSLWDGKLSDNAKGIRVDYTLDKYFVPENTGVELEEKSRKGELFARIKVYNGYSLLKEIGE